MSDTVIPRYPRRSLLEDASADDLAREQLHRLRREGRISFDPEGYEPDGKDDQDSPIQLVQARRRPLTYEQAYELASQNSRSKLPTELVVAIMFRESSFDPLAKAKKSKNGAAGLMGVSHDAIDDLKQRRSEQGFSDADKERVYDPARNVQLGTAYLQLLLDRYYRGDLQKALHHYGDRTSVWVPHVLEATEALKQSSTNPLATLSRIYRRKDP